MTSTIDTNLIEAYLREVQLQITKANETITLQEQAIDRLTKDKAFYYEHCQELNRLMATFTTPSTHTTAEWHPADEAPDGNERCIVRTREGATFMYEPVNGKWPKWVEKWMYIPA